jgi:predicted AlkP superfamily phosphohydrolase/phosphomutase
LLIIGLDAATFDVIRPLGAALPNLTALMREGCSRTLLSTIPALSWVAWPSFMTGRNAGRHGVFGLLTWEPGSYRQRVINSTDVRAEPFWSYLSAAGLRSGIIGLPVTYPPRPAFLPAGAMICGAPTPYPERLAGHPEAWVRAVRAEHETFITDDWPPIYRRQGLAAAAQHLAASLGSTVELAHRLARDFSPDLLLVVLRELDTIQHVVPWPSAFSPEEPIGLAYQMADAAVGRLLSLAGPETTVLVLSDHGAGPARKLFYPNVWLRDLGLLSLRRFRPSHRLMLPSLTLRRLLTRLGWAKRAKWLGPLADVPFHFPSTRSRPPTERADWRQTRAFAISGGGLYINLAGRQPGGIVSPREYEPMRRLLAAELEKLRDPDDGQPVIERVYRREELYRGPYVEHAPDLTFITRESAYQESDSFNSETALASPPARGRGPHRREGIFIARGPELGAGELPPAAIEDIAPTILHLCGLPVPEDMDGRVLTEMLEAPTVVRRAAAASAASAPTASAFSPEEEAAVQERLRQLGYLD